MASIRTYTLVIALACMVNAVLSIPLKPCASNLRADCGHYKRTVLDEYVGQKDSHYQYRYISHRKGEGYTVHFLNMTSQKWLDESVVNNPIWWHTVTVIVPNKLTYTDSAFLWIGSGSNTGHVPRPGDLFLRMLIPIALTSGSVVAQVQQIPNQPTVFKSDPSHRRRKEDAMLAWAWKMFVEKGARPEVLPRLPMVKASVRAMDTVTEFVKNITGKTVQKYMVSGASKRGWTAWLTAAVDTRVIAMAPVVMDLLNFHKSIHHQYRSLGGWTFAFKDYYAVNFTEDVDQTRMQSLMNVVDPIVYNERYTMPKLAVSATGDEFFAPDDSYYYFKNMTGPKYLRMIPNAEHSLFGHQTSLVNTLTAFWLRILTNTPFPKVTWDRVTTPQGTKLTAQVSEKPLDVTVYHATTLKDGRRDFRLIAMGPDNKPLFHKVIWHDSPANSSSPLQYEAFMANPAHWYLGFFIQFTFRGANGTTLILTTETVIEPDTFPFPDCHGATCKGKLV